MSACPCPNRLVERPLLPPLSCWTSPATCLPTSAGWTSLPILVPDPLINSPSRLQCRLLGPRPPAQSELTSDGSWLVNNQPLVLFHFSGINPQDPSVFSKHQNRFTADTLGPVAVLCEFVPVNKLLENGWAGYSRIRYGSAAAFPDGRPIEDAMRRWLRRAVDGGGRAVARSPMAANSSFFDQPDEEAAGKRRGSSHALHVPNSGWIAKIWRRMRSTITTHDGRHAGYVDWITNGDARQQGVDGRSITAARRKYSDAPESERFPAGI